MAPVAGMLKERGFHVTGSDVNVYPPASTLLTSLGIPWNEGYREENLKPAPDLAVIGNAISRGNPEVERILDDQDSVLLDAAAARGIFSFRGTPPSLSPGRTARPRPRPCSPGFFRRPAGAPIS